MVEPGGILGAIVARKRRDVAARLGGATLGELAGRATRSTRSLADALARPGARFVMEVKRASPSEGKLRVDADPGRLARDYAGAADAISVLVDEPYFGGSYADLAAVRAAFDGPLLAKDFVVDPRQVPEARLHGADAVLAMLSVLDDAQARDVMAAAAVLDMDVLVEVHDEIELARAIALGARLIGINNRDLKTLEVDLAVTERLAPKVPRDRIVVAESGIRNRADVERLAPLVDAFLVGSALMKAERPVEAARALAFGRVKVCGLTSPEDAVAAVAAGASHTGLIFVPDTPRAVTQSQAEAVLAAAEGSSSVGVFRNAQVAQVAATARGLGLAAVQLHGAEDAGYLRTLRRILPQATEIWGASGINGIVPQRDGADRLLFDTAVAGRSGGTGRTFDWNRIAGRPDLDRSLLAGGLNPANVRKAAAVGAWALDVGSGVEAAPGRKDKAKLQAFFEALRPDARVTA
jgi:indole-3-glycerol phosphate synthase/phosphoribosylanthranilate isomerase